MTKLKRLLFICISFAPVFIFAQSKKEVKNLKIKSCTETTTEYANGKELTFKNSYEEFDKNGNTTVLIEYNTDGSVKRKNTAKYDNNKNKIEETEFEKKTNKSLTETKNTKVAYKYNANNDKTEEINYDPATGAIVKKIVFSYNASGKKTIEAVFDSENKLIKKSVYTYDKKGLKSEKKTFDANNQLLEVKKYTYAFN